MEVQGRINDTIDFRSVTAKEHLCEPCKYKNKTTQANGVCKECREYMCDSCFEDHKSIRVCRYHVMTDSMPEVRDDEITRECLKHKGGAIKYYCSKDAAVVCGDCIVEEHNGCRIEKIKDVYGQYQESEEFLTLKTKLENLEQVYRVLAERVSNKQEENDVLLAKALDVIQITRREVNKHLDILEAKAVAATNKIKHENKQALKRLEDDCNQLLKEVESLNGILDPTTFTGIDWFINANESKVRVRDIENRNDELSRITTKTFEFSENKQILKGIKRMENIGTLNTKEERLYNQALAEVENDKLQNKDQEIGAIDHLGRRDERIKESPWLVMAVYLGDTVAGAAYSSRTQFVDDDPMKVYPAYRIDKTYRQQNISFPFCLLVNPDGNTLKAIGNEARDKYAELAEENCETNYFFYDDIMSSLALVKDDSQDCLLKDKNGKCLPAVDVLSMAIMCMKNRIFDYLINVTVKLFDDHDTQFVLCTPSYLDETPAMSLLRKAALKIGVTQENLTIVSDMDAASIFYQYKKPELFKNQQGLKVLFIDYQDKNTYSVVHEVSGKNDLQQITPIDDIPIGRHTVLNEFENFLEDLFGGNVLAKFKISMPEDYLELQRDITVKTSYWHNTKVTVCLPLMLLEMYEDKWGKSFSKSFQSYGVTVVQNKLRISSKIYQLFFEEFIKMSIEVVRTITQRIPDIDVVIMYGDFLPPILQETVQIAFPEIKVISDNDTFTRAHQTGAVIVGHTQQFVKKMK